MLLNNANGLVMSTTDVRVPLSSTPHCLSYSHYLSSFPSPFHSLLSPSLSLSPSDALGLILSGFDVRKKVSVMFYELSPQRGGSWRGRDR